MATASSNLPLRFGVFELNAATGELRKSGHAVRLRPQALKVLVLLASRPGQLVTREEVREKIWGNETFVDFEHGLNLCIREVRAALDDDADTPRYVETLPKRGYRFIAPMDGAKQTARRYAWGSVTVFAAIMLGIVAVAVIINSGHWRERILAHRRPPVGRIMFAVLPFENLSGDPEQEYFSDGLTEEMISRLGQLEPRRLGVIARTSALQYKGTKKRINQIGKELGVDYILEGTVRHAGDRVRVSAQLIQVSDETHIWAKNYERDLGNILALQEEVAQAIASEVEISLTPEQQARQVRTAVSAAAHEAYLRGLYELHGMTAESTETLKSQSIEKAIGYFQLAITHDPDDALAYSGLADAYTDLSTNYRAPLEVMPKAKAAAVKAIELDETVAEAHASLGYAALIFDWDWARAEHEFRRALELNPSLARAHAGYAEYLLFTVGRAGEAIQELQRAYALDPLLPAAHGDLAWFSFLARRYKESIEAAQRVGHDDNVLALSYAELGRRDDALAAADRAVSFTRIPAIRSQIAAAYALAGRADKARAMLPGIEDQARERYVCGFNVACIYSVLGEKDQAFAWLEKAYRDRSD